MEYRDYKTDAVISREQYIANGLGRGELVVKEDCGCVVIQDRTSEAYIVYCSKHESAPDLYEALKELKPTLLSILDNSTIAHPAMKGITNKALEALAKVESK